MTVALGPMGKGSVSLRLYPHLELEPTAVIDELLAQARLASDAGFDGLMVSEHHNGFGGYLPNPIQLAGWLLDATERVWVAPCPLLLPLRPAALVAEEIAWLAARFPGRVGVGLAAGSLEADFTVMGTTKADLTRRFAEAMSTVSAMLLGREPGTLSGDAAIRRCATDPVPVVSAAMSPAACRRAADCGVGLLFDSLTTIARCHALTEVYRAANGPGPVVLIRRVAPGGGSAERQERQLQLYRSYGATTAIEHWGDDEVASGDAATMAAVLAEQARSVGADCLNLRIHAPGMSPAEARAQIAALADVRAALAARHQPSS
ncbi:MAG TPA: LLM class flavin-dependent oxidoreductase [Mycobacteriales bacterium]|nr:LLM class flavin-dependent oxidoreductase [Mycobacteriales bacterium]